jgi:integrase
MERTKLLRITVSLVNGMKPGDVFHDSELKGFGARCQLKGVSYFLKTVVEGKQHFFTIGRHGQPWTPDEARRMALRIKADPALGMKKKKEAPTLLLAECAAQFLAMHGRKLKPRTLVEYQDLVDKFLMPAFGEMEVKALTRAEVGRVHSSAEWARTPRSANHALAVLSKMMSWAEDQGLRPPDSNPCRRVEKYRTNKRERFLQTAELSRVGDAIAAAEKDQLVGPFALAAIKLLILTGARLSEILTLKWAHVDLERRLLLLPDSKTGKKAIVLNDPAMEVLNGIPKYEGNPYVIVGNRHGCHLVNLQQPWQVIRTAAGLGEVRLHDLRHTFASVAVGTGGSLPMIGRMLGHSEPKTTQRYAHLTDDPIHRLTQATGEVLSGALKRKAG